MKVLVADFSPPVPALPETGFVPDQSPEALQAVAPVDDHVRVAALPAATNAGLTLNVTVGDAGEFLPALLPMSSHAPRKNAKAETC